MNLLAAFTKRNILKLAVTALGVTLATVLILLSVKHAKVVNKSRELAAQAVSVLETDPELGFQLAARAARYKETDEAIAALRKTLPRSHLLAEMAYCKGEFCNSLGTKARLSPDGKWLLTVDTARTGIWEISTGRLMVAERGSYRARLGMFSPDGKQVFTISQRGVKIWETESWRVLSEHKLAVASDQSNSIDIQAGALSDDGKFLAAIQNDIPVTIWDIGTGNRVSMFGEIYGSFDTVAFSADGRRVVTAGSGRPVKTWDTLSGQQLMELKAPAKNISNANFSPDGKHIFTLGRESQAIIWDSVTGRKIAELSGSYSYSVNGDDNFARFSPDSKRIATVNEDGTAQVWETDFGRRITNLKGHADQIKTIVFSTDGKHILTASGDASAKIWNAETGDLVNQFSMAPSQVESESYNPANIESAAFSSDGKRIVTVTSDGAAQVWDASLTRQVIKIHGSDGIIEDTFFSPDGKLLIIVGTGDINNSILIWDWASQKQISQISAHIYGKDASVSISPDNKWLLIKDTNFNAQIWELSTGRQMAELKDPSSNEDLRAAIFTLDSKAIISVGWQGGTRIWEVPSGRLISKHSTPPPAIDWASFSPNRKWVLTNDQTNDPPRLWEVDSGNQVSQIKFDKLENGRYNQPIFSPDSSKVMTISSGGFPKVIWEVPSSRKIAVVTPHSGSEIIAPSPDSKLFAMPAGGLPFQPEEILIHEWASGREVHKFIGHPSKVSSIAFSPDSKWVVSASGDRSNADNQFASTSRTFVWEAETGRQLTMLEGNSKMVLVAGFSPNGQWIVTADYGGTAIIHPYESFASPEIILALARQRALRKFSTQEQQRFATE
ncbi:MAG: PD40 domain-containing protein [Acidobacteria bacterium]|nr:PD40 domain-containing protein [Acidobacteriota bacterium]